MSVIDDVKQPSADSPTNPTETSTSSPAYANPPKAIWRKSWFRVVALTTVLISTIMAYSYWDRLGIEIPIWPSQSYFKKQVASIAGPNGPKVPRDQFTAYKNLTQSAASVGQVQAVINGLAYVDNQSQYIGYWAVYQTTAKQGDPSQSAEALKNAFLAIVRTNPNLSKDSLSKIHSLIRVAANLGQLDTAFNSIRSVNTNWQPVFYEVLAQTAGENAQFDLALRSIVEVANDDAKNYIYKIIVKTAIDSKQLDTLSKAVNQISLPLTRLTTRLAIAQALISHDHSLEAKNQINLAAQTLSQIKDPIQVIQACQLFFTHELTHENFAAILSSAHKTANQPQETNAYSFIATRTSETNQMDSAIKSLFDLPERTRYQIFRQLLISVHQESLTPQWTKAISQLNEPAQKAEIYALFAESLLDDLRNPTDNLAVVGQVPPLPPLPNQVPKTIQTARDLMDLAIEETKHIKEPVSQVRAQANLIPAVASLHSSSHVKEALQRIYDQVNKIDDINIQMETYSAIAKPIARADCLDHLFEFITKIPNRDTKIRALTATTQTTCQAGLLEQTLLAIGKITDLEMRFYAYVSASVNADETNSPEQINLPPGFYAGASLPKRDYTGIYALKREQILSNIAYCASGTKQFPQIILDLVKSTDKPHELVAIMEAVNTISGFHIPIQGRWQNSVNSVARPEIITIYQTITPHLAQTEQASLAFKTANTISDAYIRRFIYLITAKACQNRLSDLFSSTKLIPHPLNSFQARAALIVVAANSGQTALGDQFLKSVLDDLKNVKDSQTLDEIHSSLIFMTASIQHPQTRVRVFSSIIQNVPKTENIFAISTGANQISDYVFLFSNHDTAILDATADVYSLLQQKFSRSNFTSNNEHNMANLLQFINHSHQINQAWISQARFQAFRGVAQAASQTKELDKMLASIASGENRLLAYIAIALFKNDQNDLITDAPNMAMVSAFQELNRLETKEQEKLLVQVAKIAAENHHLEPLLEHIGNFDRIYDYQMLSDFYNVITPNIIKAKLFDDLVKAINQIANRHCQLQNYLAFAPVAKRLSHPDTAKHLLELAIIEAHKISPDDAKNWTFLNIARSACDAGLFEEALKIIGLINAPGSKPSSQNQANSHKFTIAAWAGSLAAEQGQFATVSKMADQIAGPNSKSPITFAMIPGLIKTGQIDAAFALLNQVSDAQIKGFVRNAMVRELPETHLLDRIKQKIHLITDPRWRLQLLLSMSRAYLHAGQPDRAKEIINLAFESAESISDPNDRANAFKSLFNSITYINTNKK